MNENSATFRFLVERIKFVGPSFKAAPKSFSVFWGFVLIGAGTCVFSGCSTTKAGSAQHSLEPLPPAQSRTTAKVADSSERPPSTAAEADGGASMPPGSPPLSGASGHDAVKCPVGEKSGPGVACGDLHCLAFSNERSAFEFILALEPRVLGIGESHAPSAVRGVHSATRRFGELLLPALCGRTQSMILELWLPRNDCGDKRVEQVKKAQEPVTRPQAKSNQDEYVTLGHVAKRLGIAPSALVPSCDEYQSILDAGPNRIERMLELVGQRSGERVIEELRKFPNQKLGPVIITYGGALHNDAEPDRDHERYSYGPGLLAETQGKYLELDLIVPEFVRDTDVWKRQPWYKAFKASKDTDKTRIYQWAPHSYALVFPDSLQAASPLENKVQRN